MTFDQVMERDLLLVEDSEADAELVKEYLDLAVESKYDVHHVTSLHDALQFLRTLRVGIVLLDLRLPDGTGKENVEAIRATVGDVPIIVLTGMDDEQLALTCISAGANDYLFKGQLEPAQLRRTIGYAIARRWEAEARQLRQTVERYRSLATEALEPSKANLEPVKQRLPATFLELVAGYRQVLDLRLARGPAEKSDRRQAMGSIVGRLGQLGAGPRDVIDIHVAALDETLHEFGKAQTHDLFITEGRLNALEMMGLLVDYYRLGERRRAAGGASK